MVREAVRTARRKRKLGDVTEVERSKGSYYYEFAIDVGVDDTEASRLPNASQICSNLLARCESFAAVS